MSDSWRFFSYFFGTVITFLIFSAFNEDYHFEDTLPYLAGFIVGWLTSINPNKK